MKAKLSLQNSILLALGLSVLSAPAWAAAKADLELTPISEPEQGIVGKSLVYSYQIDNQGPADARKAALTLNFSRSVDFLDASPECRRISARQVQCATANLGEGASTTWTVTIRSLTTGLLTAKAKLAGVPGDPNKFDNSAFVVTQVLEEGQGNQAPKASDLSFQASANPTPYVEKQLEGSDPDRDAIVYELTAPSTGEGYDLAIVNPQTGVLYLLLSPNYIGKISLPYHVTDGMQFSDEAKVDIDVVADQPSDNTGNNDIDARIYAGYDRAYFNGDLFGAPGGAPTLPPSADLSKDFPQPGNQGQQSSCVGWAVAYAVKTYQERIENNWSLQTSTHLFSPAFVYNQINDGQDRGSYINEALDLVVRQGVASLSAMPYSDRDYLTQPSQAARQEAAKYPGLSWKTVNGIMEIKSALANRRPVVAGIMAFDSLSNLRGPNSVYNTFTGNAGGHAVTIVGYDDNQFGGALNIINSWGLGFGDNGYFWLPYDKANQTVSVGGQATPVLKYAYVLEDKQNAVQPEPDPVPPTPAPTNDQPNLQVVDWSATYDPAPRGQGLLQWRAGNTGTGVAPAGIDVSLLLSSDRTFTAADTYVVYEETPDTLAPGENFYRDADNAIDFNFPDNVQPGDYYMTLWVDSLNRVTESNEADNQSPQQERVSLASDLPDMGIEDWYANWDAFGNGSLTYYVPNYGVGDAPPGWSINLAISRNDVIGDGNDIFLFSENSIFTTPSGYYLYRDDNTPGYFSLYTDTRRNPVPAGVYYMGLWLDPENRLSESNEINNISVGWGTFDLNGSFGGSQTLEGTSAKAPSSRGLKPGAAYNGVKLRGKAAAVRKVRIKESPQGGRELEFLDEGPAPADQGMAKRQESAPRKTGGAMQQVIFPFDLAKPMPDVRK
jgi:hypothetical protein